MVTPFTPEQPSIADHQGILLATILHYILHPSVQYPILSEGSYRFLSMSIDSLCLKKSSELFLRIQTLLPYSEFGQESL